MDSLSQIALGAAVGVAVMGRRTPVWKSALWGAVAGTLPDLDVLIDHGDPIRNMVLHRAETHAPFWLTLFSLPFAALVTRLHGEWAHWRRWWLAMWLALVTHPLLDAMTVYGTQLGLPFTDYPYGVGSVFIIDPLYTLPLLVGTTWALLARAGGGAATQFGLRANALGLVLSTAYLGWGVVAQQQASQAAHAALATQGIAAERVLVTPTAFNSLLWRVLVIDGDDYLEAYYSLLDQSQHSGSPTMAFERFPRATVLELALRGNDGVQRIRKFSKGFYAVSEHANIVRITDLRMGQEPSYVFSFAVAESSSPQIPLPRPQQIGIRADEACLLPWLWGRMRGEPLPSPARSCPRHTSIS